MSEQIKYVARVEGVRELSLLGAADADYWRARLEPWGLAPRIEDGAARLMLIAADLRWKGVAFREISFSVMLEPGIAAAYEDAACLLQAFNTNRFFAFSERFFFSTPYDHAQLDLTHDPPQSLRVSRGAELLFAASRHAGNRESPSSDGPDGQFGPVVLPPRKPGAPLRHFFADIHGRTRTFPFDAARDTLTIGSPSVTIPLLDDLRGSGFRGIEWVIRPEAFHGKSKTYPGKWADTPYGAGA